MKTWEIRISTGNTNTGEVGLAFSFHLESEEKPTNEAILVQAREYLNGFDQSATDGPTAGTFDGVLFTNAENLKEDSIAEVEEVDPSDDLVDDEEGAAEPPDPTGIATEATEGNG